MSQPSERTAPVKEIKPIRRWPAVIITIFFNLIILVTGYFIYSTQKTRLTDRVEQDLNSIAVLKVQNLVQWRDERINTGKVYYNNPNFRNQLARFTESGNEADREIIESWMKIAFIDTNCDQVILYNGNNKAIAFYPTWMGLFPPEVSYKINRVKASDGIVFLDFYSLGKGSAYLGVVIPVFDPEHTETLIGKVFLRINPEKYLYPFIQQWPSTSKTAESLLARKDGDSAQYLNIIRFGNKRLLQLHFSLKDTSLAAVKGLNGHFGVFKARDYRNVPIIAAVNKVPDSPWVLVAKQDQSEVFREIRTRLFMTLAIIFALVFLITGVVLWSFWQQGLRYYRHLYQNQKERDWLYNIIERNLNEIYIIDANTLKFTFVNYGAKLNLGYSMEELKTFTPLDIKPLISQDQLNKIINPLKNKEVKVQNFITVHRRKNGTEYPVEVFLELMDSDRGPVFLAMINDITKRVEIENILKDQHEELMVKNSESENLNEELQVTNEELQQTSEELQTTNEELTINIQQMVMLNKEVIAAKENAENANRLKSSFLANMSHEIRTPLNGIMGFSELLVEITENEEEKRMVNVIMNSSTRLLDTANSILDISMLESGSLVVFSKKIVLSGLINESVGLYTALAEKKGIRLIPIFYKDEPVLADEDLTLKIINNLVNNALKYTIVGSIEVELTTAQRNGKSWVTVKVTDTGIGISKPDMSVIFDEFRQVSEGLSKKHPGSGLGLNISKRYAEAMNGMITAKSSPGEGSTFTLWLPKY